MHRFILANCLINEKSDYSLKIQDNPFTTKTPSYACQNSMLKHLNFAYAWGTSRSFPNSMKYFSGCLQGAGNKFQTFWQKTISAFIFSLHRTRQYNVLPRTSNQHFSFGGRPPGSLMSYPWHNHKHKKWYCRHCTLYSEKSSKFLS